MSVDCGPLREMEAQHLKLWGRTYAVALTVLDKGLSGEGRERERERERETLSDSCYLLASLSLSLAISLSLVNNGRSFLELRENEFLIYFLSWKECRRNESILIKLIQ